MRQLFFAAILFSLFTFSQTSAQGQGAIPFMAYQPSPEFQGAGSIGVAKPAENAMGFYSNPAQLGFLSTWNRLTVLNLPKSGIGGVSDVGLKSHTMSAGFDLERIFPAVPVTIGFGYMDNEMSYGNVYVDSPFGDEPIGKYTPTDRVESYSAGIGFKYYAYFNFGISYKRFNSQLIAGSNTSQPKLYETEDTAYDLGAMVILPASEIFLENIKFRMEDGSYVTPKLRASLGYAINNIGDEIYYVDPAQSDPLTRMMRLGYSLNFGFDFHFKEETIKLFDYSMTIENSQVLVEQNVISNDISYKGAFGDINILDNLIGLAGTDKIGVHKGHSINLFETITVLIGTKSGRGFVDNHSDGYAISTSGIFKLLEAKSDNNTIDFISNHLEFNYYDVNYEFSGIGKTRLQSLNLTIKNIGI